MKFKLILDSVDDLSESEKMLYEKNESGKFILNSKVAKRQSDADEINASKNEELYLMKEKFRKIEQQNKELTEKIKTTQLPSSKELLEKDSTIKEIAARLDAKEKELARISEQEKKSRLVNIFAEACLEADAIPDLLIGAVDLAYSSEGVPCVMKNGKVQLDSAGDIMTVQDYVASLKEHEVFKRAFNQKVQTGLGGGGDFENTKIKNQTLKGVKDFDNYVSDRQSFIEKAAARGRKALEDRYK